MSELIESLFRSIVPIFIFVMIGLGLRRLGAIGEGGTNRLSRSVIYFFFPTLVLHRLAITEDPSTIISEWMIHACAVVVLIGSGLIGWIMHSWSKSRADKRIFIFMIGMPNWIYLPLALAGPLWGDEAVRLIILFNIPTQILLWTVGIWLLHGTIRDAHAIRHMILNPGFVATIVGLLIAFGIIPVTLRPDGAGISLVAINPVLHMVGGLTIPLSLIALGLYLGEKTNAHEDVWKDITLVIVGRILIAPVVLGAMVLAVTLSGVNISSLTRWVVYLIVAMPVAVSAPMFAQMFGHDRYLASRGVVMTSMISFITAPLFVVAAIKIEIWLGLIDGVGGTP